LLLDFFTRETIGEHTKRMPCPGIVQRINEVQNAAHQQISED
jgi:hypothetical protein